jgi:hypothetical protein
LLDVDSFAFENASNEFLVELSQLLLVILLPLAIAVIFADCLMLYEKLLN